MHWLRNYMCIPHVLLDTLTLLFLMPLAEQVPVFSFSPGLEDVPTTLSTAILKSCIPQAQSG